MKISEIRQILVDTDYVRTSGRPAELKAAEYLKAKCEEKGFSARIEAFPVAMADLEESHLYVDGREIPCRGSLLCGSGEIEAPLYHMPGTDRISLAGAKGKIVLLERAGMNYFLYKDLWEAGAVGFITCNGNANYRDRDINQQELRPHVAEGKRMFCANINVKDAVEIVKSGAKTAKIVIKQKEYQGESHNVIAEIPGQTDQWIVLSAHYDSTFLSRGSYDNMTGCIGILGIAEALKKTAPNRMGIRLLFCGSEERGLLGSKAYCRDHEEELKKIALNINIDMIGTIMGRFLACVSAEDKLVGYIEYLGAELGWGIESKSGVYSSDSTPFADHGVPALSFARIAGSTIAPIHNRYDTMKVLSPEQIRRDIDFMTVFTDRMANAAVFPVGREIPQAVKDELDKYLNRKR